MLELLAEDVYVTMIPVKPVAKNLCLLYATITAYRLCPNRGRSIVCDTGLWLISAGGYLFVSTVCDGQLKWICASGRTSTVFDVPLNGRSSPVMQVMNNWCLLYTPSHAPVGADRQWSTVFDARLNGRESLVLPGMNNGCLLDATSETPDRC